MKGRQIWSCGPCTILLLCAILPEAVTALFRGSGTRDTIHRVFKVKITEDVRLSSFSGSQVAAGKEKRGASSCPSQYALCPSSLGGDCCPENYACAQSSCYATTAAVSTCQGQTGYYACPLSLNGGCCQQGLLCATDGCSAPAGSTYTQTCQAGYFACPASMNYGCCENGMGCAISSCVSTSPSTTTITYTTTTNDGSAVTITTTSVTTPPLPSGTSSASGESVAPKVFPSSEPKVAASKDNSGSGHGGLSKGAVGGIVAGAVVLLIAVLIAAFFVIRQLKKTEKAVQSHRETTSGTRTRRTAEMKSESHVNVHPTPSEIDRLDYDPLMMTPSTGLGGQYQQHPQRPNGRSRRGSDAPSQPSVWSGPSADMRATPSLASEAGDRGYFELPPRENDRPGVQNTVRYSMASSADSNAQYNYHNFVYPSGHVRHDSQTSELSAGSDEYGGSQRGPRSPVAHTFELAGEGEVRPELPGSDTDTESNGIHGLRGWRLARRRKRQSTNPSINNVVSPMSTTTVNRPPMAYANRTRRRGTSNVSAMSGQSGGDPAAAALGSIDEGLPGTNSLHGHYGPPITGPSVAPDMNLADMPGLIPVAHDEEGPPSQHGAQRQ
ncbi:hypothetical protein BD289DRAFT_179597 [Coniella lustricola]|uniref:Mid2 domain-containing protein n=1 Tax=Coniella lustricola TaxID=2025994 RepID=A0A2T2ZTJ1_9PEZI|nr:hypothetical protein BD289DRAFT_179597 [Coniella lustricola]